MAYYTKSCVVLFLMMAVLGGSMGAVYNVGDNVGWTNTGVDYQRWSDAHVFEVGDKIVFKYDNQLNDVVQVSEEDYNTCNADNPIETYNIGNDTIEFTKAGNYFYFCSFPNKCLVDKQKLEIKVPAGNATTVPPPFFNSPPPQDSSVAPPPKNSGAPPPETSGAPPPETSGAPPPETSGAPPPETSGAPPPETSGAPPPETSGAPPPETSVATPPADTNLEGKSAASRALSFNKHLAGILVFALALYLN